MRLMVDASSFLDNRNGVARRAFELWPRIAAAAPEIAITLVVHPALQDEWLRRLPAARLISTVTGTHSVLRRVWTHSRFLQREFAARKQDFLAHDLLPPPRSLRSVPTIHDLRFLSAVGNLWQVRRVYGRFILPMRIRSAPFVVTVSRWMAEEIEKHLAVPREKIVVARNAPAVWFTPGLSREAEGGPYFLVVGHLEPRKNPEVIVQLAEAWRRRGGKERWIFAGRVIPGYLRLQEMVRRSGLQDQVTFAGAVSDDQLLDLYRGASAVLMPSHLEGFGLPVLEAMACGTVVVAPTHGPFPEVAGERALIRDIECVDEWLAQLEILKSPTAHRLAREAGFRQVQKFSWDSAAAVWVENLRRCAADQGSSDVSKMPG